MSESQRIPFSAVIITRNEERRLPACLESVKFADEVLVVDSGSTDATLDIARAAGATVIEQSWLGYGAQKRFAVKHAKHDWVLCIDADERVSERLRASIEERLTGPKWLAYEFPRRNTFLGRQLKHGEGYPDWSLRLFDRRHGQWSEDPVHEKVLSGGPVGRLNGDLIHESADTLRTYLDKQNRYTTLQAESLYAAGARATGLKLILSPLARFIKFYVIRGGFLDGRAGLVHILIGCFNSFMKNAKLLELERNRNRK